MLEEFEIKLRAVKSKEIACKKYIVDKDISLTDLQIEEEDEDVDSLKSLPELKDELKGLQKEQKDIESRLKAIQTSLDQVTDDYYKEGAEHENLKTLLNDELLFKQLKTEKERKAYFKK